MSHIRFQRYFFSSKSFYLSFCFERVSLSSRPRLSKKKNVSLPPPHPSLSLSQNKLLRTPTQRCTAASRPRSRPRASSLLILGKQRSDYSLLPSSSPSPSSSLPPRLPLFISFREGLSLLPRVARVINKMRENHAREKRKPKKMLTKRTHS